jgi:hypothetical protein
LPANFKGVSWTATFISTAASSKPHFQWAAAVYPTKNFGTDLGSLDVKPVDKDNFSVYPPDANGNAVSFVDNGDHAGTPEYYKSNVTAGARGSGGKNYTGNLAAGPDIKACVAQPPDAPCVTGATAASFTDTADFNSTPIPAQNTIWFSSVVNPDGIPANQTTTLRITNQSIKLDGLAPIPVPDGVITFSPAVTTAKTTFDAGTNTWHTTVPTKDVGNIFAAGVAVPVTTNLPGNLKSVGWTATSDSPTANVKPHFQWSAAVYPTSKFGADLGSLDVKPVDKDNFSVYPDSPPPVDNGDHAGTPEWYKANVIAGARGNGGTNYTGGLAAAPDVMACIPQRVIIDTDMFSSVDDIGGVATAFALQLNGDAKVLAIGINTRMDRPRVAINSWKCAAALEQFYTLAAPIGAHMPDDGVDPDVGGGVTNPIGPCAGTVSPPAPDTAVNVYRRALAAAPDGSVVVASTGYFGNLADLLASPPDAISPLKGSDLVARKVSMLVSMAGGYPSRGGENNLEGDPVSAQYVATNWPTKLVWAGYEVGDVVHTGCTLKTSQPADSPVLAAYTAAVGLGNYYQSYDLVAVYHALEPDDPSLTEVGAGKNTVDSGGGNVFTLGAGNQYYLALGGDLVPSPCGDWDGPQPPVAKSLAYLLATLPPGVSRPGS